ncbi:hypothetical protein VTL71DRAFT_12866 [Oculimacula yallundae]|uniref:DUF218 domain-containing protein n=1 Tax=Oculimacula yallundae TaxID=86028 RepID=A0ABR4CQI2_9HELO
MSSPAHSAFPTTAPPKPTHLIIVCCHAIYTGPSSPSSFPPSSSSPSSFPSSSPPHPSNPSTLSPSNWLLAPFQKDEIPTFISHIQAGLNHLVENRREALLVFSGSKTRPEVEMSEARSYLNVCEAEGYWGLLSKKRSGSEDKPKSTLDRLPNSGIRDEEDEGSIEDYQDLRSRVLMEEQALDSFHNVLFSLLLFWKKSETWPESVTIVSHEFKRARFMDLHIPALRIPRDRVTFNGIDPGYMVPENTEFDRKRADDVREGERERGFGAWEGDLLGMGAGLRGKRVQRNFWGVDQRWFQDDGDGERRRCKSAVRSRRVEWGWVGEDGRERMVIEEVLEEGRQPWEE